MGIKRGYPLREVKELPQERIERCFSLSVSTVEELLSHYAQDPENLSRGLEIPLTELRRLVDITSKYISPEAIDKISRCVPKRQPLGAKSPYSPDFEKYIVKRRQK